MASHVNHVIRLGGSVVVGAMSAVADPGREGGPLPLDGNVAASDLVFNALNPIIEIESRNLGGILTVTGDLGADSSADVYAVAVDATGEKTLSAAVKYALSAARVIPVSISGALRQYASITARAYGTVELAKTTAQTAPGFTPGGNQAYALSSVKINGTVVTDLNGPVNFDFGVAQVLAAVSVENSLVPGRYEMRQLYQPMCVIPVADPSQFAAITTLNASTGLQLSFGLLSGRGAGFVGLAGNNNVKITMPLGELIPGRVTLPNGLVSEALTVRSRSATAAAALTVEIGVAV